MTEQQRGLRGLLKRNRQRIKEELKTVEQRRHFSPAGYSIYDVTRPAILEYTHGKVIDVGCGDMAYKDIILSRVSEYDTMDRIKRFPEVKFEGDVQDMHFIKDETYDTVISTSVLEHVRNPFRAVSEMRRILKKGGTLIISAPMLCRLHEEPYDFFRFTKYGFKSILEDSGFKVIKIMPEAGLFSFIGHQFSTVFVCAFWHIPVIKNIAFFINKWLCVMPCYLLDKIFDKDKSLAYGYTCVAEKI